MLRTKPCVNWSSAQTLLDAALAQLAASKGVTFDRLFLRLMLRHHEGGIEMANYAEQHAQLPEVRAAAGAMIIDQTNECNLIKELLQSET